jgi:hypothetical protein
MTATYIEYHAVFVRFGSISKGVLAFANTLTPACMCRQRLISLSGCQLLHLTSTHARYLKQVMVVMEGTVCISLEYFYTEFLKCTPSEYLPKRWTCLSWILQFHVQ